MAWKLVKRVDDSNKIILLTGQDYVIGRKGAEIVLSGDQSISRLHAIIRVDHSDANVHCPNRFPVATIKDSSKYGTVVNGKKLESGGASSLLNNNDIIQFGIFDNVWRITYTPFVCATSGLSKQEKRSVSGNVLRLGGHLGNEWSEQCSHLIMNKVFMTMKVVNALASRSPILTPKYLEDVVAKKSWSLQLKEYEPPKEKSLFYSEDANFQPDERRQSVLSGRTFYVLTAKQETKVKFAVTKSGGKVQLIDPVSVTEDDIRRDASCFLEPNTDTSFNKLSTLLQRFGKRFVSEGEIGLAILLCSTDKYCNPKSNEGAIMQGSLQDSQVSFDAGPSQSYGTMSLDINELNTTDSLKMEVDDIKTTGEQPPVKIKAEPVEIIQENVLEDNLQCTTYVPGVGTKRKVSVKQEKSTNGSCKRPVDQYITSRNSPFKKRVTEIRETQENFVKIKICSLLRLPSDSMVSSVLPTQHPSPQKVFVKVHPKKGLKRIALRGKND